MWNHRETLYLEFTKFPHLTRFTSSSTDKVLVMEQQKEKSIVSLVINYLSAGLSDRWTTIGVYLSLAQLCQLHFKTYYEGYMKWTKLF